MVSVDAVVFAHWENQIWKQNPSAKQKKTFARVKSVMRVQHI